jgi:hypothetical protein
MYETNRCPNTLSNTYIDYIDVNPLSVLSICMSIFVSHGWNVKARQGERMARKGMVRAFLFSVPSLI